MTDFSSLDKLMEFGLGMGVAQQMMKTMDYSISNMAVPGVGLTAPTKPTPRYFALIADAQAGPLSDPELVDLIKRGLVNNTTLMWYPGLQGWMFAKDIPDVYKQIILNS